MITENFIANGGVHSALHALGFRSANDFHMNAVHFPQYCISEIINNNTLRIAILHLEIICLFLKRHRR